MDNFNVDSVILDKMGDGLQNLIQGTGYQPASSEAVQGVNLNFQGEPGAIPGQQVANAVSQQVIQPQPSVTPSYPANQPDPVAIQQQAQQAIQHFQDLAFQATAERIQAEEEAFEARISGLDDDAKEVERVKRERDQLRQLNEYQTRQGQQQQQRFQSVQQQDFQRRQQVAKSQTGVLVATKNGLPYDQEWVQQALMAAQDRNQMERIAQGIAQSLHANHAANVQNQINRGVFSAGGNTGSPALGPQPREGRDSISDLIGSRGYVTVAQR